MDIPVMEIEGVIENDYKGIHIKKSVFIKRDSYGEANVCI